MKDCVLLFSSIGWKRPHVERRLNLYEAHGIKRLLPFSSYLNSPTRCLNQRMAKRAAQAQYQAFKKGSYDRVYLHVGSGGFYQLLHFYAACSDEEKKKIKSLVIKSAPINPGIEQFSTFLRMRAPIKLPLKAFHPVSWAIYKVLNIGSVSKSYMKFYDQIFAMYPGPGVPILMFRGKSDPLLSSKHLEEFKIAQRHNPLREIVIDSDTHANIFENHSELFRAEFQRFIMENKDKILAKRPLNDGPTGASADEKWSRAA